MHQCKHCAIASQVGLSDFCKFVNIIYIYTHRSEFIHRVLINQLLQNSYLRFDFDSGQTLLSF